MNVIPFPIKPRRAEPSGANTARNIAIKQGAVRTFLRDLKSEGAVAVVAVLVMPDGSMHGVSINVEKDMVDPINAAGDELMLLIGNDSRIA